LVGASLLGCTSEDPTQTTSRASAVDSGTSNTQVAAKPKLGPLKESTLTLTGL
tara:strand:- start:587 stop:745 length:159 start_codon:yes stop_codon:yes gene_type:complete